jgi:hypothetical protein
MSLSTVLEHRAVVDVSGPCTGRIAPHDPSGLPVAEWKKVDLWHNTTHSQVVFPHRFTWHPGREVVIWGVVIECEHGTWSPSIRPSFHMGRDDVLAVHFRDEA